MMTRKRKTMIAQVVLKGNPDKIPDFGLGKGIIYRCEIEFTDADGHGFNGPLFAMALNDQAIALMKDCVEVKWTPKQSRKKDAKNAR